LKARDSEIKAGSAAPRRVMPKEPWYRKHRIAWFTAGLVLGLPVCFIGARLIWGCSPMYFLFFNGFVIYSVLGFSLFLLYGLAAEHSWDRIVISTVSFPVIACLFLYLLGMGFCGLGDYDYRKTRTTVGYMMSIGRAIESYQLDNGFCPQVSSIDALQKILEARYVEPFPTRDAYNHELRYLVSRKDKNSYVIVSFGLCGEPDVADISEYLVDSGSSAWLEGTSDWKNDIVFGNGQFLKVREGGIDGD
jgi:hypothetical protein